MFQKVYKQHAALNTVIFVGSGMLCLSAWFIAVTFVFGWIGFAVIMLRLVYLGSQASRLKDAAWIAFATMNGWQVTPALDQAGLLPLSLQFGHNQIVSPVIQAQLGAFGTDLFGYKTVTGGGNRSNSGISRLPG